METAVVFIIGGAALAVVVAYIAKSLQKKDACRCSSKNCSIGNTDCDGKSSIEKINK